MRKIQNLGYFERQMLIDRVGRAIATSQGWQVKFDDNILEAEHPRLRSYAEMANVAIEEIELFLEKNQ